MVCVVYWIVRTVASTCVMVWIAVCDGDKNNVKSFTYS